MLLEPRFPRPRRLEEGHVVQRPGLEPGSRVTAVLHIELWRSTSFDMRV